jgi:hypothetical protein
MRIDKLLFFSFTEHTGPGRWHPEAIDCKPNTTENKFGRRLIHFKITPIHFRFLRNRRGTSIALHRLPPPSSGASTRAQNPLADRITAAFLIAKYEIFLDQNLGRLNYPPLVLLEKLAYQCEFQTPAVEFEPGPCVAGVARNCVEKVNLLKHELHCTASVK